MAGWVGRVGQNEKQNRDFLKYKNVKSSTFWTLPSSILCCKIKL